MTKNPQTTYKVELALMKADIVSLKSSNASIEGKLDKVIEKYDKVLSEKADKSELLELKKQLEKDSNRLLDFILRYGPVIGVIAWVTLQNLV